MRLSLAFALSFVSLAPLAPHASAQPTVLEETAKLTMKGKSFKGTWHYMASETPRTWVFLQHGFMRKEKNLDALAHALAEKGLAVVSFNMSDSDLKNESFITDVARTLEEQPPRPSNLEISSRYLLAGHSLGGNFVARVAAKASTLSPSPNLAGVILLDPVEHENYLAKSVLILKDRIPELAILGEPNSCNSNGSARKALAAANLSFAGIHIVGGSHCDPEGDSSDWMCSLVCGASKKMNSGNVQEFAASWAEGLSGGSLPTSHEPGGDRFEELVTSGAIRRLE